MKLIEKKHLQVLKIMAKYIDPSKKNKMNEEIDKLGHNIKHTYASEALRKESIKL
jgi:hypothetical protein